MKVPLKIFFAGVGTGIVLTIVAFALLSDPPPGARHPAAGGWTITMSTNEVQYQRPVEQRP
jgi:hypothetical protein